MIQGWIAAFVTLALIASQATIQQPRTLADEQTTIAALEHPPLPATRAKHRSGGSGADTRRASPPHAIVPGHIALARADARIADVSTTPAATSSDARSPHGTQSRAPPAI